ncbi:hypothetical protein ACOMHN_016782 [Nucella lapillus]
MMLMVARDNVWTDEKHQLSAGEEAAIFCVLLGAFSLVSCFSGVSGNRVAYRRLNMTFEMGRDATLTCNVRGIGKKRVIWKRLADPIPIALGTTKFQSGNKYRVKRDGDNWQLVIKNVRHSDAGEYECRLTGRDDVADILSLIIPSANYPHFLTTQTTITTRVGSDVVLPCHVNSLRKSLVMWFKDERGGGKVLSLRKKVHSGDRRHKIMHTQKPEWSLQIRKVKPDDLGIYTCVVNTSPPITRTVELVDGRPGKVPEGGADNNGLPTVSPSLSGNPQLVTETFKDQVVVSQYTSVTLTCQFKGDPEPTISWERRIWTPLGEKMTQDLKTQGETYTLTNAQPADAGIYVCKANNRKPPPAQGRIRVKVKEVITTTTPVPTTTMFDPISSAAPRAYARQEVIYQEKGRDAQLGCRAVGIPRPIVHWYAGQKPVEENYKYGVLNVEFRQHTVESTLHVRSLISYDFQTYTCYVVNSMGHTNVTMKVFERIPK